MPTRKTERNAPLPASLAGCALLAALGAATCGTGRGAANPDGHLAPDPCAGLERQATAIWNTDVQAELSFSVRIYRGDLEAADAELVVSRLNRFTKLWITAREAACRQRETGAIDGGEQERLESCLASVLDLEREVIALARTDARSAVWRSALLDDGLAACTGGPSGAAPADAGPGEPAAPAEMKDNPFAKKKGRRPGK